MLDDTNEIDLRENNLLSLRVNLRLRRWCWSYFIVHCSFPISKFFFLIFTFIRTVNHFNFFRPSEALARENFPISNISRPRVVLYFLLSRARYTRLLSLVYFYMGMENLPPLGPRVGDQKIVAVCFAQPLSCCFIRF